MENDIKFSSYIWKDKINYRYKTQLTDKIVEDYNRHKKENFLNYTFKFNDAKTNCFMKQFNDNEKPVFNCNDKHLIDELTCLIKEKFKNYMTYHKINGDFTVFEMWYSLYEKGMETFPHHHESDFSGIYYLKYNFNKQNCTFFNINQLFFKSSKKEKLIELSVVEEDIIFFPSSILHGTKKHVDDDFRIVIAFDILCPDFSNTHLLFKKKRQKICYN